MTAFARKPNGSFECGHDHSGDLVGQWLACTTATELSKIWPDSCAVVVLDGDTACASAVGNVTSLAMMARKLVELALQKERPSDCVQCAANWDLLRTVALLLKPVPASCY